jgi:hypothetical protein
MKAAIVAGLFAWGTGVALFIADDAKKSPPATPTPAVTDDGLPKKKRIRGDVAAAAPTKAEQKPAAVEPKRERKTNDDVEGALDETTFADFSDTPLAQAIQFMGVQHNIRIHLDETGMANAMVDRDQGITMQQTGVRLALFLDLLLEPLNLDYAVRENVLFISSKDRIENLRATSVLRIGDMLPPGGDPTVDAGRLVELITENIDRENWSSGGGENVIKFVEDARSLVVTSNGKTQRKISKLLNDLRSAKLANGMPIKKAEARVAAN